MRYLVYILNLAWEIPVNLELFTSIKNNQYRSIDIQHSYYYQSKKLNCMDTLNKKDHYLYS